jgi:hypothetical protein
MKRYAQWTVAVSVLFIVATAAANADENPAAAAAAISPTPSTELAAARPSPSPSPASTGASVSSEASASDGPIFYNMVDDIDNYYDINRTATYYYQFRESTDGSGRAKRELRYGRNLWNNDAIVRIRIPFLTKYPVTGNPYSGLGNIELGYSYNVAAPDFDHSLEARISLPTAANKVSSNDTQLKGFYTTKWKFKGGSFVYVSEYDQSIFVPPGSSWTSYYEGKIEGPNTAFQIARGIKFAGIYNFRVLMDTNGLYKQAAGGTIFGNLNDVALSITDTWGGSSVNSLWKYQFEFNATAKF